jgi:hypothetical protein
MNEIERAVAAKQLEARFRASTMSQYGNGFSDAFAAWLDGFAARLAAKHGIDVTVTDVDALQDAVFAPLEGEPCGGCKFEVKRIHYPAGRTESRSYAIHACQAPVRGSCGHGATEHVWGLKLGGDPDLVFDEMQFWFHLHPMADRDREAALHHFEGTEGFDQLASTHAVVNVAKSRPPSIADLDRHAKLMAEIDEDKREMFDLPSIGYCGHTHGEGERCAHSRLGILDALTNFVFDLAMPTRSDPRVEAILAGDLASPEFDYLRQRATKAQAAQSAKDAKAQEARAKAEAQEASERAVVLERERKRLAARRRRIWRFVAEVGLPLGAASFGYLVGAGTANKVFGVVVYGAIAAVVGKWIGRFFR